MKVLDYLQMQSRSVLWLGAVVGVLLVGLFDYLTGPEIGFSIFYLLPICTAARMLGRTAGLVIALLSAVAWLSAELVWSIGYSHPLVPWWNAAVRLGLFSVSGALTAEVARRKKIETELVRQSNILQSILNSMGDGVIVADAAGKVFLFNPAARRLLGDSFVSGTPDQDMANKGTYLPNTFTNYPTHEHPLLRATRGEPIDGAEMFIRGAKDRPEVWLNVSSRPLIDQRGTLQGGVVVFSDVTSRKVMEKQITDISEREQRRMGEDLHDGLCQHLVSTAFASAVLKDTLDRSGAKESAAAEQITELINDAIGQARNLARGLYPVRLEVDGLASALEQLVEDVQARTTIACEFRCDQPVLITDHIIATSLYRIVQEAVNNAVKHSGAKHITVELESVEDELTVTVTDDGKGFPGNLQTNATMGLAIMNYRARMIGASLDIRGGKSGGTTVLCSLLNTQSAKPYDLDQTTQTNRN